MHDRADAALLTQELDRDLLELAAAQFSVQCFERQLRSETEHLVHPPEKASGALNLLIHLLKRHPESGLLFLQGSETGGDDDPLFFNDVLYMLSEGDYSHEPDSRARADGRCSTGHDVATRILQ